MASSSSEVPNSGFTRAKTKTVSKDFFPGADLQRPSRPTPPPTPPPQELPVEEPAPPPPVAPPAPPPERPSASQRSSGQLRAYAVDGPVEAVGLQADSEFWHIFEDTKTLGRGHFAKVKQVSHLQTREEFAAKILDKTTADNDIEDLVREFQMLRSLRHPNIIRLYAAYETPKKLYLVTEVPARTPSPRPTTRSHLQP